MFATIFILWGLITSSRLAEIRLLKITHFPGIGSRFLKGLEVVEPTVHNYSKGV